MDTTSPFEFSFLIDLILKKMQSELAPAGTQTIEGRIYYVEKAVAKLINQFEKISYRLDNADRSAESQTENLRELSNEIRASQDQVNIIMTDCEEFKLRQKKYIEKLISDLNYANEKNTQSEKRFEDEINIVKQEMERLLQSTTCNTNELMTKITTNNREVKQKIDTVMDKNLAKIEHLEIKLTSIESSTTEYVHKNKKEMEHLSTLMDEYSHNLNECQLHFKNFASKLQSTIRQSLNQLQLMVEQEVRYLDNILRAEIKTRISTQERFHKDVSDKWDDFNEHIQRINKDSQNSWEYLKKQIRLATNENEKCQTDMQQISEKLQHISRRHLHDFKFDNAPRNKKKTRHENVLKINK
ncbi:hypothetical protein RFI_10419 [Reticulomyxa filosa]|uniref:Uncharacterized protein n=1 Tax=Reticulomyxa filosa TaxID=46433 RepID=X6NLC9_RETFI|nr:hypothetical protein RFI_10419 [Reticulomyxa filosa]|eukprot:ETO26718.1 hypothetical protein RFI_10419 [Reticulomyxa filosa]